MWVPRPPGRSCRDPALGRRDGLGRWHRTRHRASGARGLGGFGRRVRTGRRPGRACDGRRQARQRACRERRRPRRQARGSTPSAREEQRRHQRKAGRVRRGPERAGDRESSPPGHIGSPAGHADRRVPAGCLPIILSARHIPVWVGGHCPTYRSFRRCGFGHHDLEADGVEAIAGRGEPAARPARPRFEDHDGPPADLDTQRGMRCRYTAPRHRRCAAPMR